MGGPEEIFNCRMCGDCCKGFGGTLVGPEDMRRLAEYVGVAEADFRERFCAASGLGAVLAQKSDGFCVFYEDGCTVHPVKPAMCRKWPFIEAVLKYPENWRAMAGSCPGMKADADPALVRAVVREALATGRGAAGGKKP